MMTFCAAAASTLDSIDNIKPPKNFEEAMQLPNWDDWCYVTCKELDGMKKMNVFSKEEYTLEDLTMETVVGAWWPKTCPAFVPRGVNTLCDTL